MSKHIINNAHFYWYSNKLSSPPSNDFSYSQRRRRCLLYCESNKTTPYS